jgi:hypothetical protein
VTNAFGGVKFDPEKGWVVPKGAIHPAEKAKDLARFKVFPNELTEAHILPFVPDAAKIDQKKDKRLSSFAKVLSDNASVHAVATALMERESWDFTAVYYDGIDHFSHAFMAYHPPRLEWIKEEDFEMYKDVLKGAYRFHDMMLERLLDLAGRKRQLSFAPTMALNPARSVRTGRRASPPDQQPGIGSTVSLSCAVRHPTRRTYLWREPIDVRRPFSLFSICLLAQTWMGGLARSIR